MKNSELVKGLYIKEGEVDWVKYRLEFDVKQFSEMLITYKDVFEANKGFARIDLCLSKNGKMYGSLNTYKKQVENETHKEHLSVRDEELEETDLPF